jgi:hypothetical protein
MGSVPEWALLRHNSLAGRGGRGITVGFLDFASGRMETLFQRKGPFGHWSLSVLPDERWILYGEQPVPPSELVVVENFR